MFLKFIMKIKVAPFHGSRCMYLHMFFLFSVRYKFTRFAVNRLFLMHFMLSDIL